ncbi:MAG: polyribonucleotide nucleotidyltransferase [Clostridia bacterium]|nr:polyribonucleotide nucleotidyltransferase [Clostridia bacterium]
MLKNRVNLTKSINLATRELSFNVGGLANQANGSVLARYGDTMVLVTATASEEPREGIDFFPLTVDYEERLYAAGKIPGGFIKREGKPTEKATLSSRLIDRPLRPLFPEGYRNDVHIVVTVLSVDQDNRPNVTAINGASAALALSDIPFYTPVGAVWIGRVDGELVVNPTIGQWENSDLDLIVAGTKDSVVMVEAGAKEVSEDVMLEAIELAHKEIKKIVTFIEEFVKEAGEKGLAKEKIKIAVESGIEEEARENIAGISVRILQETIESVLDRALKKKGREKATKDAKEKILEEVANKYPEIFDDNEDAEKEIKQIIEKKEKEIIRKLIVESEKRVDNRGPKEIRPIECTVGILPRAHGSGLFTRGETQVLTVGTLGALGEEQILDGLEIEESKQYLHHYNFPPYSVGETRPMRGPGRREIGHGALAEKALECVLPSEEEFPYTIRLVSEVLESNGSSSMASVCGSSLALMDAGVPIKAPVAGIAMGLVKEGEKVVILTDIQGLEDALGDMDFKVAGTGTGITALQMDIKADDITTDVLRSALAQAHEARMAILEKMNETIEEPREDLSPYAPRIFRILIDPDKIRDIIGPGGKTIKKIIDETNVKIDIEDDGRVFIASVDKEGADRAIEIIEGITEEVEVGKIYLGKVTRTTGFGAFVEVIPGVLGTAGKEGMVHISQLAHERVEKVEDIVKEGEEVLVKATGFDQMGRLRLSRKEALKDREDNKEGRGRKKHNPRTREKTKGTTHKKVGKD